MKRVITCGAAIFIFSFLCAVAAESEISPKLTDVKIYLQGAELTHSGNLKLKAGVNNYLIQNLAENIDPNSINVSLGGRAVLMSVNHRSNYLKQVEISDEEQQINDTIKNINWKIDEFNNQNLSLDEQYNFMITNRNIISAKDGFSSESLKDLTEYYFNKILEIKNRKMNLNRKIIDLNTTITKYRNQLNEIKQRNTSRFSELIVSISSESVQSVDLKVQYYIQNAGWRPFYDIRAADINSPLDFRLKSYVHQSSGLDWDNVNLTVSTRNPVENGNLPVYSENYLDFIDNTQKRSDYVTSANTSSSGYNIRGSRATETQFKVNGLDQDGSFIPPPVFTTSNASSELIDAEYTADMKYSFPSDGKEYKADLATFNIKGKFEYYTAPKLKLETYMIARITNWEEHSLLGGEANVYFGNTYIGKISLDPMKADDTLDVSFGKDKNIVVERNIIRDYAESKFLSNDIERTFAYKITLKNNKKTPIKIIIKENIPISKNEKIIVKLEEQSGGKFDQETGEIEWNLDLESGKSVDKKLIFSVRHPKDRKVTGVK
ncbi:MAG: DUF4139 domain-containing protein [Candidatus Kapabacteria bacterium]|nr:DUF4139 domain-containing protein [Candidatus Kapabacteria bacterium]